jgi:hypothetical protein
MSAAPGSPQKRGEAKGARAVAARAAVASAPSTAAATYKAGDRWGGRHSNLKALTERNSFPQ